MLNVILDAIIDSLKVFGVALLIFVVFSLIEEKITNFLAKRRTNQSLIGAACGLIPQCGISVVAADLYKSRIITSGALLAVFFACSDEALPILLTSSEKLIYVIPLLIIKFVGGFSLGFLIDFFLKKKEVLDDIPTASKNEESKLSKYLIHPLLHSLKIFLYVLIINLLFEIIIFYTGEEILIDFLRSNKYITPLLTVFFGLIPNCASSALMSELFIRNGLPFGALVTGLCANAGLGMVYLLKFKEERLKSLGLIGILMLYSLIIGYAIIFIMELVG